MNIRIVIITLVCVMSVAAIETFTAGILHLILIAAVLAVMMLFIGVSVKKEKQKGRSRAGSGLDDKTVVLIVAQVFAMEALTKIPSVFLKWLCIGIEALLFAFLVDRFKNGTAKERDSV